MLVKSTLVLLNLLHLVKSNLRCYSCAPCNEFEIYAGDITHFEQDCYLDRYCMKVKLVNWLILIAQCGKYENLLSNTLDKNFVKEVVLVKKLQNSWFHEKIFDGSEFLVFPHCVSSHL